MVKALLLAIAVMLASVLLRAQVVTGRLMDEKGAPVDYANIALLRAGDSSLAAGGTSDSTGSFSISSTVEEGSYFLRINAIGFAQKVVPIFSLGDGKSSKDIGIVTLVTEAKTLKEVSVTASRPTIVQKGDRLEVNIEGTTMAAGNTAFTVLSRVPGVFIDHEGNIQLNGRSGVTVMIDGKLTFLSATDLRNLLESMSAENIKTIEIISNPSAKYDAAGTAGILNINFKKSVQQGLAGSVYSSYFYNFKQHIYSAGSSLFYKSGGWNSFLNVDFARRAGGREATFTRVFYAPTRTTYFDQSAIGNYSNIGPPSVRLGTDYTINDQHSIGFIGYFSTVKGKQEFLTDTYIGDAPGQPSQFIDANNYNTGTFTNATGNLHYLFKPDTLGSQLSADLDYVRISNLGEGAFYNTFTSIADGSTVQDNLYTRTPGRYDIASAKVDYSRPLAKKYKLEIGSRVSRVESDNDFRFYFNKAAGLVSDPQRTNHFNYRESIYAAYLNWSGPLSKKLTLQAGLRGEQTVSRGESYTTGQVTNRSYFGLFPSVFLQHAVSEQYTINYSYSRRLTRPNYGSLNPFRSYRDPYTWTEGNPLLRPSYTHSFNLVQTYKKVYNLTLSYQLDRDLISELPILDVDRNITIYTTGNVDDAHNADATALVPVKFTKWWDSQNTLQLSHSRFSTMSNNGPLVNKQTSYMIQSVHTVRIPRDVRMELSLLYRGPEAYGLYRMAPLSRVDVGFRKNFLKKLDVTLQATDIFRGNRLRWTTDINGNVNDFDQYFRNRRVGIVLRYKFSRGHKVDERRREATVDEMNRT